MNSFKDRLLTVVVVVVALLFSLCCWLAFFHLNLQSSLF